MTKKHPSLLVYRGTWHEEADEGYGRADMLVEETPAEITQTHCPKMVIQADEEDHAAGSQVSRSRLKWWSVPPEVDKAVHDELRRRSR